MNAAPWHCKLRPSRQARLLHGALASGALLIVASAPLPATFWLIKIPLLLLMLRENGRQQRQLAQRRGMLQYKSDDSWRWQGARWRISGPIRWLPGAALLVMRSERGETRRLWLMQDMMPRARWRQLRARLLCRAERQQDER
ncbi:protein YgfX [Pantoea septica]|uniref:protein YgfX n=1 Tax=Pantoea septica TaxID=472695 RepID=UPI0023F323E5|nr:protein YgfX [Pantoea septica]